MKVEQFLYGKTKDGREVPAFTVTNAKGAYIELVSYGATLNKIVVPDRNGALYDVLVGFDTMEQQEKCTDSQGRTVGRVANRIAGCGITIDGKNYPITKNVNGVITLHSNHEYEVAVWQPEILGDNAVRFTYESPEGAEGFPGNVKNAVTFSFDDNNAVKIHYECVPDRKTALNVTNHSYFNLEGFDKGPVTEHVLQLFCDAYTPTDAICIPTGEIRPVKGTPFDFRLPKKIGRDLNHDDEQLKIGRGYDHNFCIENYDGTFKEFAAVWEPKSGRVMRAYTDLPGVQFYIGNFLDGSQVGKAGKPLQYRQGFCLETQYYPDCLNHPAFPPCLFTPENPFVSTTIYQFSAE